MDKPRKPSYLNFDKNAYPWKSDIDYRLRPELYKVGRGEQGVLICEPYKSELVAHWHFKTPEIAQKSSEILLKMFHDYLHNNEFVGADLARKYLQMGYTRARRYANYAGGKKYDKTNNYAEREKGTGDPQKAKSAEIFYKAWQTAEADPIYAELKQLWKMRCG